MNSTPSVRRSPHFFPTRSGWNEPGNPRCSTHSYMLPEPRGCRVFMWYHTEQFVDTLFYAASPRAIVLVSPNFFWHTCGRGLVRRWAAAVSVAPHTEEIAQSVVDALLWVASNHILLPYTTINTWSWLTTRPSLPPFSMGRYIGTHPNVVRAVRSLEDTKVLKAYLLLLWSEWIPLWDKSSLDEMCASMREDFGGIGIGHHRADLIQRLDPASGSWTGG